MSGLGFVEVIEADSAETFLSALSIQAKPFRYGDGYWLFRGHSDDRYRLIPTVLREEELSDHRLLAGEGLARNHWRELQVFQILLEFDLLGSFLSLADECGLSVPDLDASTLGRMNAYRKSVEEIANVFVAGDTDEAPARVEELVEKMMNRFESEEHATWPIPHVQRHLALARHYGIPTRFIDWSVSPRVAAFFAAASAAARDWGPDYHERRIEVWAFSRYAGRWAELSVEDCNQILRVPYGMNRNLASQRGRFSVRKIPPSELAKPVDRRPADQIAMQSLTGIGTTRKEIGFAPVVRVQAPIEVAGEVLWWLDREGINRHVLFPDFSSMLDSLKDVVHHREPDEAFEADGEPVE